VLANSLLERWTAWRNRRRQQRLADRFAKQRTQAEPDLSRVLFVCYGNICRSAFADAYWNQRGGELPRAHSAGFHPKVGRSTPAHVAKLAQELGVELTAHRSQLIDSEMVERASAIFVMDGQNLENLQSAFPDALARTWLLGTFHGVNVIRDPYMLPEPDALTALRQIKDSVDVLLTNHAHSR
jgi:protein-tyrosine-phosphatase